MNLNLKAKVTSTFAIWLGLGSLAPAARAATDLYAVPVKTIDGDAATLAAYKGKTLLIVNTASKCGYTPQYKGLQALYDKYKDRGLVVLGFPSNDFWHQDPGSDKEIKTFCTTKYDVKFPLYAKGPVKGKDKQPLFAALLEASPTKDEIAWNFEKFVVSPEGKVTARFLSKVEPDDAKVVAAIEAALPAKPK